MAAAKFAVGIAIGSLALISEALHSSVDVIATIITWLVVRVSDQPADEEHHYGHGKFESLSALFVIALLYVLAGGILVESWSRLREGAAPPTLSAIPFVVLAVDIAVNFWRARALHRTARATRSQALAADALHFASDVLGSIAVIIGLVLTGLGHAWGDSAAAIAVAVMISILGLRLGRSTIETLLDRAPEGASEKATLAIRSVPGVVGVQRVRVRMVGPTHFIDAIAKVPRTYPIDRVEAIKKNAQAAVSEALGDADLTFTAVPVARDNESVRERIMVIARNSGLAVHHVTVHDLGGKLTVSIDLEVDGDMELNAAHDIAHGLERNIREDFGEDVEVDTHIEPLEPELPAWHRRRARARRDHQGRAGALCRQRRHPRHPQCAGARHRRRRNRQLPLPRSALDERHQGARERRRDRARAAPRVSLDQARDQSCRTAACVALRARSRFGLT